MLPKPVVERHEGVLVVRDDLLPGGTKRRVVSRLLHGGSEFVYASPACGYAQVALAHACREAGYQATVFTAKRKCPHIRTMEAVSAGAKVVQVPCGYLSNVQAKAWAYARAVGAVLLPFGLDVPEMVEGLRETAAVLSIEPSEVWTAAGSGVLSRSLQIAWPGAAFRAVAVGAEPLTGRAVLYRAPERFEQDAKEVPPFPSCSNYDAKAWQFVRRHAGPGALFWNVAA